MGIISVFVSMEVNLKSLLFIDKYEPQINHIEYTKTGIFNKILIFHKLRIVRILLKNLSNCNKLLK
jgi:hypothetical protein